MREKRFQRKKEDFQCGHCALDVNGNGYTNHCPHCLWSKHVDIQPGDRKATCNGMMEPILLELLSEERVITHQCLACGYKKRNKTSPFDNHDELIALSML